MRNVTTALNLLDALSYARKNLVLCAIRLLDYVKVFFCFDYIKIRNSYFQLNVGMVTFAGTNSAMMEIQTTMTAVLALA